MGVMERYNEKKKKQSNTGKVSSNIGVKERFELNKKYADLSTDNFVEQKQAVQPVNQSVPVNSISEIDNAQERKAYRKENDSRIAALDRQISALQDKITEYNNKYSKSGGYVPSASNYNRPGINQVNTYNKWRSEAAEYNKQLKSLSDKRDALVAENNIYDRGQGVLDSYYDYTQKADFNAASSKRNYNNASRQELNDYDIRNDASLSYYGADGSLYNGMNEKVSADYWDNLSAPKIEDKLGLFLSTEQKERQEAYGNLSKESTWEKIIKDGSDGSWDELNEDEQKIYYYLLNTSGSEAAYKFLDEMKAELNKRSDAKSKQKIDDAGIGAKLAANAASVPASVFGGVTGFIEDTANILRGKEINPYSSAHSLQNFSQNVRTSTAEDINKATDDVSFLGITLGDVYQSGMSAADSALGIVTGSKTYGALMGMSAAASTAKDLYERGATNAQIAVESLLSGVAEMAFEKWSLDKFTDRFLKKGKKGVLEKVKNVLIQGGVEASEETFTELANVLTDSIVMAGQSNYNVNVEKYINDGKTEAQAQALALRDAAGDVWKAAVGGFISGDIMGGVGTAVISDTHNKKGIDIDKGARAIYNAAVKSAALGTDSAKQGLYDSLEMRGYTPQQGILRGIAEVTGKKFETLSETGLDAQTLSVVEQISDKLQVAFDAGFFNENFSRVSEAVNSYAASVKVGQDAAGLIIMDEAVNAKPSKKSKIISAAQERYQNNNITTIEQVRKLTKAEIKNMLNTVNNQTADNSVNYLNDIVKVIGDAVNKEGVRLNETQRRAVNDILLRGKVEGNLNTILEDEHTTNILSNILGLHIDGKKSVTAVKNRVKSMLAAYKSGNGRGYNNAARYRKMKMDMIDAQLKSAGISDPEIVAGFRNAVLNGDLTRKQAKAIAESEAAFNIFAKNSGLRLDTKSGINDLIRSARTLAGFDLSADDAYYFAERDISQTVELSNSVPDGETGIFDSDTGRLILNKNAELQKKLSYTLAQHVIRDVFNSEKIKKYSYNELIKKPDMKITKISGISEDKFNEYKAKRTNLIDDAIKNARLAGNEKNTDTAVYLHCDDLNEDIMISSKSLRHSAARFDNAYANICLNLSDIIKNSIAVNELIPRKGSNGSVVLLGIAESDNDYVLIRTIVNKRTWKANDYKIIYAINKQAIKKEDVGVINTPKDYLKNEGSHTSSINSISDNSEKVNNKNQTLKKEDVGVKPPDYLENEGSSSSSTISISNLLEIVKDKKLINSVLSEDVLNALNSKRIVDENVSKSLLDANNKDDLVYSVIDYMKSHDVDVYSELKRVAKKYRSYMMGDQTRLNGSLISEENLQREIVADWLSNAFLNKEILEQLVTDDMSLAMELFERVSADQSTQGISKDFKEFASNVRNTLYSYLNTDFKTVNSKKGKRRTFVQSAIKSDAVDSAIIFEDLDPDKIVYEPISNQKTLSNANEKLSDMGYDESVRYFNIKFANEHVSLNDIALGERLIQEAVKRGDTQTAGELIQNVAILGTELGQKVQALSIIKRLTPEGQLGMLKKIIERGKTKGDKAYDGVELTQEMIDKILNIYNKDGSYDQKKLTKAVEDVKQQIAEQMKVTKTEKINAWRYLSMLGNPKTHIRNIVPNIAMRGTVAAKNLVARTIETIAPVKERTKTFRVASEDVKSFAETTTKEMRNIISGDSKYSEDASIKSKRAIFKNKILNGVYEFNSDLLSKEDWWFSRPAFKNSLSEYLTANGVRTRQDIENNPETVEKAKNYALEQSQIATFRQYSWLANKINEIERKNTATDIVTGAILPFKKTPINIAKTALNYSPLGFAKALSYDAVQVKKGNIQASQMIDNLAQGITGTALTLIGYMLAKSGFLNGAGDDDKESKYDYQLGEQPYSVNIGGETFSLSWLSPIAMPLFVGANAYEQLEEGKEWNGDVVIETLAQTLDPLSEMSFLSNLNDVLSSYDSGIQKFAGIGESMAQNYITQFTPTLLSQIAQVKDDTKRSTKVGADSGFKFFDETINKLKYKIPFLRETLEPSTDIWGNEIKQADNIIERAFETFLAPYARKENIASAVDEEIKALYHETGDEGLIPSVPYNYINYDGEKHEMSDTEFTEFKKQYGEKAFDLMEDLFNTQTYRNASSEDKADMINGVYDYARDEAKKDYFSKHGVSFTNATSDGREYYKVNSIKGAIEKDMPVEEYEFFEKYPDRHALAKTVGGYDAYKVYSSELYDIKSDKDESGKTISGSRKEKVLDYINNLNIDYYKKIILFKSEYNADDRYNHEIIDYLNSRDDISYSEMASILKELGFTLLSDGSIKW